MHVLVLARPASASQLQASLWRLCRHHLVSTMVTTATVQRLELCSLSPEIPPLQWVRALLKAEGNMVIHLQAHSEDLVDTAVGTQGCALETYRILCSLLGSPKVPWKILWLVTFLLAEEAKDLRRGVVDG